MKDMPFFVANRLLFPLIVPPPIGNTNLPYFAFALIPFKSPRNNNLDITLYQKVMRGREIIGEKNSIVAMRVFSKRKS
jgi:hypothetical protein